jgi:type II secretory pathway pseudopilin PulG
VTFSFSESRRGFVLLEAVVALAIIGLVAIALLSTTSSQLRTASKATVLLTARSLAEDRIAAIRFLNYDDLSRLPDSLVAGRFPPPFNAFEWTTVVEEMENEYDLFGAEVVVNGLGESFPLRTLVHAPRPVLTGGATDGAGGRGGEPAAGRGGRGGDAAPGRGGRGSDVAPGRGGRGGDIGPGRGGAQVGRGRRGGGGGIESHEAAAVSPAMTAVRTTSASGVR